MNIVSFSEMDEDKKRFFHKHDNDFTIETSGNSAEYYRKTYSFVDGSNWYEVSRKVFIKTQLEHYKCLIEVELLETEYWSSDDSESKYYYSSWKPISV